MVTLGDKLSSEEFAPNDLVRFGRVAEESGFAFALISDHFHPWTDAQGQSPLVWSVIGALAHTTSRLMVGTGVTCPTMRLHPTLVAQAAATSAAMMQGRFIGDGLVAASPERELVDGVEAHGMHPGDRQGGTSHGSMRGLW